MKKPTTRAEKRRMTNIRQKYSAMENNHTFGKRRAKGRKTFLIQTNNLGEILEDKKEADDSMLDAPMKKMEIRRPSKSNSGSQKSKLSAGMRRKMAF